jgi:seryl-tRNA(Sec) selenium transferase
MKSLADSGILAKRKDLIARNQTALHQQSGRMSVIDSMTMSAPWISVESWPNSSIRKAHIAT